MDRENDEGDIQPTNGEKVELDLIAELREDMLKDMQDIAEGVNSIKWPSSPARRNKNPMDSLIERLGIK